MKNNTIQAKDKKPQPDNFLLVGIGASAGGIKALKELFTHLPADTGMAYVVIIHLAEDHDSSLHHILQTVTKMPVTQITESIKVEINHVYVIPPARHLEMVDGIIHLTQPVHVHGRRISIDRYFRSLAEAYRERSVGIILSGSGSDGTLGLKHIKSVNGFAMVQSPDDAGFDSMPASAIATGLVDVVMPVRRMGEKLVSLRQSTQRFYLTDDNPERVAQEIEGADSLRELVTFLRLRTGNDFTNYKRPTLLRRIARHLQKHEVDGIPAYLDILQERPEEVDSLIKNLLINVTNFFRDKEAFEMLETTVLPRLFHGKTSADQLRIWIAGCASGEEAYSFAILLSEYADRLADPPKIQVFASDVDKEAVAEAKQGRYTEAITEDVSPERLHTFFTKEERGYVVKKKLKELILFTTHNLLRDPPFSRLDLVSCRNVLIYLNRDTQEKLMRVFHFALKGAGILFLGSSESADTLTNLFSSLDKKSRIYLRRENGKAEGVLPQMPIEGRWQVKISEISTASKPAEDLSFGHLHHRLLKPFLPASVLINEEYEILHLSENAGRFLRFVGGHPTSNLIKVVLPALRSDLRATLFSARQRGLKEASRPVPVQIGGQECLVSFTVQPLNASEKTAGFLLVLFHESASQEPLRLTDGMEEGALSQVIQRLEEELQRTKDQLQKNIEQYETSLEELKASNEEQQAINEELRSASEELETGKEEIQSVNEELITINNELKEKVEEVSRINSDLQNLMSSTDIGTIFLDRSLKIKRFTPHLQEYFNLIATDVGRPLGDLKHSFNYDNFGEDAQKVLRNLQPITREVEDKNHRYYILSFFPYRSHDDKIDGVVLTFVDITERRQSEISRIWLSSIVESSADAIISFSPGGMILNWNKGAEKVLGYTTQEMVGQPVFTLAAEKSEPDKIFSSLLDGENISSGQSEGLFIHKDGRAIHVSLTILLIKDKSGATLGATAMVQDITERKRAEAELREKNKELQEFAYVTSHDLQEPLTTISSFISLIEEEEETSPAISQYLEFIKMSANRLKLLIADLLKHTRIGYQGEQEMLDFSAVVAEVMADMKAVFEAAKTKITIHPLPVIKAYPTEIRLLFQNLLSNAIKFHREGIPPVIHIRAMDEDTHWHFVMQDNGIGIEEKYKERIFIIFQRLHPREDITGTGIGLAHCKKIVELHHGRIWLESEVGAGSEFHFTIPKHT